MKSHSAADARPYQWQTRVLPALFHLRCPLQSHQRPARGRTRLTTVTFYQLSLVLATATVSFVLVRSDRKGEKGVKHMSFLFLDIAFFSRAAWNLFDVGSQSEPPHLANNIPFGSLLCPLEGAKTRPPVQHGTGSGSGTVKDGDGG